MLPATAPPGPLPGPGRINFALPLPLPRAPGSGSHRPGLASRSRAAALAQAHTGQAGPGSFHAPPALGNYAGLFTAGFCHHAGHISPGYGTPAQCACHSFIILYSLHWPARHIRLAMRRAHYGQPAGLPGRAAGHRAPAPGHQAVRRRAWAAGHRASRQAFQAGIRHSHNSHSLRITPHRPRSIRHTGHSGARRALRHRRAQPFRDFRFPGHLPRRRQFSPRIPVRHSGTLIVAIPGPHAQVCTGVYKFYSGSSSGPGVLSSRRAGGELLPPGPHLAAINARLRASPGHRRSPLLLIPHFNFSAVSALLPLLGLLRLHHRANRRYYRRQFAHRPVHNYGVPSLLLYRHNSLIQPPVPAFANFPAILLPRYSSHACQAIRQRPSAAGRLPAVASSAVGCHLRRAAHRRAPGRAPGFHRASGVQAIRFAGPPLPPGLIATPAGRQFGIPAFAPHSRPLAPGPPFRIFTQSDRFNSAAYRFPFVIPAIAFRRTTGLYSRQSVRAIPIPVPFRAIPGSGLGPPFRRFV